MPSYFYRSSEMVTQYPTYTVQIPILGKIIAEDFHTKHF